MQESLPSQLSRVAALGRYEDQYLGHLAAGETVVPMPVLEANPALKRKLYSSMQEMGLSPAQYTVGSMANSINPLTGQPEFSWLSKGYRKLERGVKKLAKKVAPILLPIVAPFLLPAMPLAFSAGLGSFAGGLLAGQKPEDALRNAVITGAFAGVGNKLTGGSFFGSRAAPTSGLGTFSLRQQFTPVNPFSTAGKAGLESLRAQAQAQAAANVPTDGSYFSDITPRRAAVASKPNFFERNIYNPEPNTLAIDPETGQLVTRGEGRLESLLSPNRASLSEDYRLDQAARKFEKTQAAFPGLSNTHRSEIARDLAMSAYKEPTALQRYGPLAATGIAGLSVIDTLQGPEQVDVAGMLGPTGEDLYQKDIDSGTYRYAFSPETYREMGLGPPYYAKHGGEIRGPGTDVSDSIPAMLSDGEFVMTAAAVRGAGKGDRAKGALRMYELMREFEEASQDG